MCVQPASFALDTLRVAASTHPWARAQVVLASIALGLGTVLVLHTYTHTSWLDVPDSKDETVQLCLALQVLCTRRDMP